MKRIMLELVAVAILAWGTMACDSTPEEPESDETVGEELDEAADDTADAVDEAADDTDEAVDEAEDEVDEEL